MAVTFTTIKNTNLETVIKFQGVALDTGIITLADLGATTQARNTDAPVVNMVKFLSTGLLTSGVTITRNGTVVLVAAPENAPVLDLNTSGISDNVANDKDLTVSITGAAATGYIVLRKVSGWSTKVEPEQFGSYDNVNQVGA